MGIDINISGATKLVGLVGSPVEHSMSPVMHSDSFQKMGGLYGIRCNTR